MTIAESANRYASFYRPSICAVAFGIAAEYIDQCLAALMYRQTERLLQRLFACWSRRLRGHRAHRFACGVQPRHYGADGHVEYVGDLGVEQSFEDDQREYFPLLGRKPRKRCQHLVGISPVV
jgi:hypothetical protein